MTRIVWWKIPTGRVVRTGIATKNVQPLNSTVNRVLLILRHVSHSKHQRKTQFPCLPKPQTKMVALPITPDVSGTAVRLQLTLQESTRATLTLIR